MTKEKTKAPEIQDPSLHMLFGDIDDIVAAEVCSWILSENLSPNPVEFLHLIINSQGGDVEAGFAIVEFIKFSKIPVKVTAVGTVCSAALIIFMAGAKGHRVMTPTCSIMSHDYRMEINGPHHELVAIQKELKYCHDKIVDHYKDHTTCSTKIIDTKLVSSVDNWLTVDEALKYGICDAIGGFQT